MSTFGQSAGAKIVDVHDVSVQFQRDALHGGLQLHATVADQHVHEAITLNHLIHNLWHAVHVTEVQDHKLGLERLGGNRKQERYVLWVPLGPYI